MFIFYDNAPPLGPNRTVRFWKTPRILLEPFEQSRCNNGNHQILRGSTKIVPMCCAPGGKGRTYWQSELARDQLSSVLAAITSSKRLFNFIFFFIFASSALNIFYIIDSIRWEFPMCWNDLLNQWNVNVKCIFIKKSFALSSSNIPWRTFLSSTTLTLKYNYLRIKHYLRNEARTRHDIEGLLSVLISF